MFILEIIVQLLQQNQLVLERGFVSQIIQLSWIPAFIIYLIDLKTRKVKCNSAPIEIGGNCVIKKGSRLPKGTILAGTFSMVNKDHTSLIPDYSVIAGSPANFLKEGLRRVKEGLRRVNNHKSDIAITKCLNEKGEFVLDKNVDINGVCYPETNLFRYGLTNN